MKSYLKFLFLSFAILACSSNDEPQEVDSGTKLRSVTWNIQETNGDFRPSDQRLYTYSFSGKLSKVEYFTYDIMEEKFALFSTSTFNYADNKLLKITEVNEAHQTKVTSYTYENEILKKIAIDDEVDTQASITYEGDTIQVFYAHSNGRSFTYRFSVNNDNIGFERTIDDSQKIGSKISNEFDSGLNPYNRLGYMDVFFTNYSRNNKTKITSEYFTNFPQSIPVSFEYEYNSENLPMIQMITYKSYSHDDLTSKVKVEFEYSKD